jgi:flagellar biosynthesis protein FlhA
VDRFASLLDRRHDLALGAGVVGLLVVLLVPLPSLLLDFLITTNLTLSLLILFVGMYVRKPLEFSVFPSLLLVATLYRLSLNVAATRLILLHGSDGPAAAGRVIQGFGQFVIGGNFVVGVVLFLILVVIQFVVITKGAGRVAEVAARFTLDALPGKQMAIDADLNAGILGEAEARHRREQIAREADFYGAMDGSSKFVRGDAIATLVITAINIVGGLLIGVLQEGQLVMDALATYTILTVGDGLVAQLPALVTSTAAGIVVTRAASESDLSHELLGQLAGRAQPLAVAAGVLAALSLFPGLPLLPFLAPAAVLAAFAWRLRRASAPAGPAAADTPPAAESVERLLPLDPLELEVGYSLLSLVEDQRGGSELLDRIRLLRRQLALDLGIVVPPIRIRDNAALGQRAYAVRLRGHEVARGELQPDRLLAMNPGGADDVLEGLDVREPTFGLPARWIDPGHRTMAQASGYTVVDPPTVVVTHLSETLRRHAAVLLDRQAVQALLNQVKESQPAVVDGLVPALLPLGTVHRVLQRLLAEGVSIRDLPTILDVVADTATATKEPGLLAEHARAALGETVCRPYLAADGSLPVLVCSPDLEAELSAGLSVVDGEETLSPQRARPLLEALGRAMAQAPPFEGKPAVLVAAHLRRHVRRVTERALPQLAVLSYAELPADVRVRGVAVVEVPGAPQVV